MEKTEIIQSTVKTLHEEALATALAASGDNICPRCRSPYDRAALTPPDFKCSCGLELAYPDLTPSGEVKGILGWLHSPGAIVHDRYRIVQMLGRGGFGSTYLVEDMKLGNKRRALKEVPDAMYDEHEIRILSKLNHPSVPDITDRAVGDGMIYIILEFGGSRTLESVRRSYPEKRVPLSQLAPWVRQLCDVLAYIHAQQPPIVHRDLKPGNILLDDADRIMLIDFGIAKEAVASEQTRALGRAVTHGYSPPEQAMGTGTDARSDVYALGATVYYLLTGQRPPGAPERIQGAVIVEPSRLVPGIPPAIDRALVQSLALNPNERQQDVKEFGKAFDYDSPTIKTYVDTPERTVALADAMSPITSTGAPPSIRLAPDGVRVIAPEPARGTGGIGRIAIVASIVGLLAAAGLVAFVVSRLGQPVSPVAAVPATNTPIVPPTPAAVPAAVLPEPVVPAPSAAPLPPADASAHVAPMVPAPAPEAPVTPPSPAPATTAAIPDAAAPLAPPPIATPTPTGEVANTAPAVVIPEVPQPPPRAAEPAPTAPVPAEPPPEPAAVAAEPKEPAVVAKQEPAPKPVKKKKKIVAQEVQPMEPEPEPEPVAKPSGGASAWQKANEGTQFIEGN